MNGLREAGADVDVIAPNADKKQGYNHDEKADMFSDAVKPQDYDALVLPGGVQNPDALRLEPSAVAFIKNFVDAKKPIFEVCHGSWTLIATGGVKGREMTSWPSLKTDVTNTGATWVDQEVVVDGNLVTS